ncbi:MAG: sulfate/thiosulfate ABC transporter permease CysW, partial [Phyllobacteriaceae bacterium]|nr:sulfate/thiosulfate ABC transporter permease CysW [Phyllobacteriaceae bacterium]
MPVPPPIGETAPARRILIGVAAVFLALVLALPLAGVFTEGLRKGLGAYFA